MFTFLRNIPAKLTVMLMLLATGVSGMVAPDKPRPIRLPHNDVTQLSGIVCGSELQAPENKITAWMERNTPPNRPPNNALSVPPGKTPGNPADNSRNPPSVHADVECKPHQVNDKFAAYHAANCVRAADWQCGRRATRLRAMFDQRPLIIHTNGYKPETAYSLVSIIAAYRTQKGDPVLGANTAQCSLAKGSSKELLDVTCDGKIYRLSYWCPKSSCPRLFSIDGYFVPADAGGL